MFAAAASWAGSASGLVLAHAGSGAANADVPPPPTLARLFGQVSVTDVQTALPLSAVLTAALLYLYGVWLLHRRGDAWSKWRTASWLLGLLIVAYAVAGGLAAYDDVLFSAHAVQHMLLATVAPIPLALAAPITLALRTLPPRPRHLLTSALHSLPARVLAFPLVGFVVLIVSMYGLYFTSLYGLSLRNGWVHGLVHMHFLLAGCLFFWPIIGVDPLPKLPYWGRLVLLFVTFPAHALLALAIMSYTHVFAADWYADLHRTWGSSPLADQQAGGGLMWASGELVGALVFVALFVQWSRADERDARRKDRQSDRVAGTEQDELVAYNAWLARLAARDSGASAPH